MNWLVFVILFILIYIAIIFRPKKLHEGTIALIGAILVILFGFVSLDQAVNAIIGNITHPYHIVLFFISFALISTTLEDLGFFKWCAIKATLFAKHDGLKLFNYLFLLVAAVTFITANDIVILTLTPFVLHMGLYHNRHPKAYLFTLFIVANTGSIGHLLGNLTNMIVGSAFSISFLEYIKYMFLPMIVALIVEYLILRKMFSKEINQTFTVDVKIKPEHAITDQKKLDCVLGILVVVLVLSAIAPFIKIDIWLITMFGAVMTLILGRFNPIKRLQRIPWQVALFLICLFVIVAGFNTVGIVDLASQYLSRIGEYGVIGSGLIASYASALISSVMNNIPATATMTDIAYGAGLQGTAGTMVIYGIIIGSNLGANITIIGALAGLMWLHLIREKGFEFHALEFTKLGLIVTIPTILATVLLLAIEVLTF